MRYGENEVIAVLDRKGRFKKMSAYEIKYEKNCPLTDVEFKVLNLYDEIKTGCDFLNDIWETENVDVKILFILKGINNLWIEIYE